jgi:hypothetical protein
MLLNTALEWWQESPDDRRILIDGDKRTIRYEILYVDTRKWEEFLTLDY